MASFAAAFPCTVRFPSRIYRGTVTGWTVGVKQSHAPAHLSRCPAAVTGVRHWREWSVRRIVLLD
jgi:hypothetical protein